MMPFEGEHILPRTSRPIAFGFGLLGVTGALAGCSSPAPVDHSYEDGLYSAVGRYTSPGGAQGINVAVQLEDDIVSWVMVTPRSFFGEPAEFQMNFASGISDVVVGMDIDQIAVSRVAGSSLTSSAFNQAIAEIKSEAVEE
jgi:hypothetical protein